MAFAVNGASSPSDSFTTSNLTTLNANDQDMGTSGQLVFQATVAGSTKYLVATMDKSGEGYVLFRTGLGGYLSGDTGVQSKFNGASSGANTACVGTSSNSNYGLSTPHGCDSTHNIAFYNNTLFHWPFHEDHDMCAWNTGTGVGFVCYPAHSLSTGVFPVGWPGGMIAVTADPTHPTANPVMWAIITGASNSGGAIPTFANNGRGYLYAYSATLPVASPATAGSFGLLYNTPTSGTSTDKWLASPFAVPTVVNGKVYVPTYDSGVVVYY